MSERLIDLLLRFRWLVIAVVAGTSLCAAFVVPNIKFNNEIDVWFVPDDPELKTYRDFLDKFAADQVAIIGLFADDVFTPEILGAVEAISDKVSRLKHVHRVRSLTATDIFKPDGDNIVIEPAIVDVPTTAQQALKLKQATLGNPLLSGTIVDSKGKATAIVVELAGEVSDVQDKIRLTQKMQEIANKLVPKGVKVHHAGSPAYSEALSRYSKSDFFSLTPFGLVFIALSCLFIFRQLAAGLIPLLIVGLATLWTAALMAGLNIQLTVVSSALNGLIAAVGVADSIHVLAEYYRRIMAGQPREQAARQTFTHLLAPCFFTSATTVAGLLSLQLSGLKPIREFGFFGAIGITLAFLLSITLLPVLLRILPAPGPAFVKAQERASLTKLINWLGRPPARIRRFVLLATIPLLGIAGWAIANIDMGANMMKYFREGTAIRESSNAIDAHLGGTIGFEIMLEAPADSLKDPRLLKELEDIEGWMAKQPHVGKTLSIVDQLHELNRVMHSGKAEFSKIPETRNAVAQYYLLLEGEQEFDALVRGNYSLGRISVRYSHPDGPGEWSNVVAGVDAYLAQASDKATRALGAPVRISSTGFVRLVSKMEDYLLQSQVRSFIGAFIIVTLMMFFLLRSFKLACFAMIPNLVPILLGMGVMSLCNITLNPGTMMIASIALGLVVDDTVHFLYRLRHHIHRMTPLADAIASAIEEASRPIIVTSLVLAGTFLIWIAAKVVPSMHFGFISAIVILFALVADLLLLPAILLLIRPRFASSAPQS